MEKTIFDMMCLLTLVRFFGPQGDRAGNLRDQGLDNSPGRLCQQPAWLPISGWSTGYAKTPLCISAAFLKISRLPARPPVVANKS